MYIGDRYFSRISGNSLFSVTMDESEYRLYSAFKEKSFNALSGALSLAGTAAKAGGKLAWNNKGMIASKVGGMYASNQQGQAAEAKAANPAINRMMGNQVDLGTPGM